MKLLELVKKDNKIKAYIQKADESLSAIGYTEHSFAHVTRVSNDTIYVLKTLGYDEKQIELGGIAGYLHDIGNVVHRQQHAQTGAIMAFRILDTLDFDAEDISDIISAIGNHDEGNATCVSPIGAALILADKSDVRRSRVRNRHLETFDIHDRVNYAVTKSKLNVNKEEAYAELNLEIDTTITPILDYFEIFLGRMLLCKKASDYLGLHFRLVINGQRIL
ncbi:HD domain-containing protein [Erysipelotrichaceae bacterium OH741_COT-311]|nr:HD domain-containing protein [Erysipelotrichaceae bacterium OH741_COT-311]